MRHGAARTLRRPRCPAPDPGAVRAEVLRAVRTRVGQVVADVDGTVTAFAERVGVDRTTLSQLLSERNRRLPRIDTLMTIAAHAGVSVDWLLGLSDDGGRAQVVPEQIAFEQDVRSHDDDRLIAWFDEARDARVRYVPATLPDILKTETVIRYELRGWSTVRPEQKIETAAARLAWQRRPDAEMECCSSVQSVEGFAKGEGIWSRVPAAARRAQLEHMAALSDELYPAFRWFLFDGLQRFAVPVTIFGTRRAAIYAGHMYLVFNAREHVTALSRHFDQHIRAATVQPPTCPRCSNGSSGRSPDDQRQKSIDRNRFQVLWFAHRARTCAVRHLSKASPP